MQAKCEQWLQTCYPKSTVFTRISACLACPVRSTRACYNMPMHAFTLFPEIRGGSQIYSTARKYCLGNQTIVANFYCFGIVYTLSHQYSQRSK